MVKIIRINHGIASRCGDIITINKKLKEYPKLEQAIIDHEMTHSSEYKLKDLSMEFSIPQLKGYKLQYYKFILTHPSSWTEYLPITIENKKLRISPSILIFWLGSIALFYILFKLL